MKRRDFMLNAPAAGFGSVVATAGQTAGSGTIPMPYLDWLARATTVALERKEIGTPVSVRVFLQITSDHGLLTSVLAGAVRAASDWFDSRVFTVFAQGTPGGGTVTALVEFDAGQTALLTAEAIRQQIPSVTVLFFGNHGTMRFDDSPVSPSVEPGPSTLVSTLERSVQLSEPVEVGRGR